MSGLSSLLLLVIFLACAGVIWGAGVILSDSTDVLCRRLRLGEALSGVILLAIATNLPEIAITASAALAHQVGIAVGNILGGIAIQTAVLALLDALGVRPRKPLSYLASTPTLLLECAVVVAMLLVVIMATQLPESLIAARVTPGVVLIVLFWIVSLWLVRRARRGLSWPDGENAGSRENGNVEQAALAKRARLDRTGVGRAALVFAVGAAATLLAGVFATRSGEVLFGRLGLSGVVFGATVLAAATALPEVTTGLTSTRLADYQLAVSDILGGNAFLPVLFLLATLLSGRPVLPSAHHSDIYLTALGGLLTIVYLVGLIFRPHRQWLRMGPDSVVVLLLYLVGIAGLALVPT